MRAAGSAGAEPPGKRVKLENEQEAPTTSGGVNLIEVDGKSCTHEVAWPPGELLVLWAGA